MTMLKTQSGAPVETAAYGTMQWGDTASEDDARAMFEASCAAGIIHFDTAALYAGGVSEEILGKIAGARDDIFVATKAAYNVPASAKNLRESLDTSQTRLRRDVIDLLYLHRFDDSTPLEESFETLATFQQNGAIRYIGVSNFAAWQVMKAQAVAARLGTRIDAIQPMLNLVKRQAEIEILPMARDQEISIFSYSPLGGGLLTGKYTAGRMGRLTNDECYAARYGEDWMLQAAVGLSEIAERVCVPSATLAIAWLRRYAPEVQPILSARSATQLASSLDGLRYHLEKNVYDLMCKLVPPPPPATDRIEEV